MSKYAENLNYVTGKYVRCLNNKRFLFFKGEPRRDEELVSLVVGKVYKLAPPEPNDGELLRVIDESGEDYLYPASYFEPLLINDEPATDSVTTHLPGSRAFFMPKPWPRINRSASCCVNGSKNGWTFRVSANVVNYQANVLFLLLPLPVVLVTLLCSVGRANSPDIVWRIDGNALPMALHWPSNSYARHTLKIQIIGC